MDNWSYYKRPLNLHELLVELENDDTEVPDNIVLFPPSDVTNNTDEDSGEEDYVGLNNLPASQLRAAAEVASVFTETQLSSDSEDDLPLSIYGTRVVQEKIRKKKRIYKWCKNDLDSEDLLWKDENGPKQMYTPMEAFSLFFDEQVFSMFLQYSNGYANLHNRNGDISDDEIRCFFGVLLLSGYTYNPRRAMYWQNSQDTHNVLVSDAISRNRFDFIMQNIHCCDNNNLNANDKFTKLRSLIELLNKKFMDMAPMEEAHSIDESMVPYFGRHGTKQFIRGKPIRWGYKLWTGTTKTGYIEWFEPYQGATTFTSDKYKDLGLGPSVVLHFSDILRERYPDVPFHLYFDNFFTTLHLIEELKSMGLKGTGTIRENRIGKECTLSHSTILKKKERGIFEYVASDTKNLVVCKWHDNNVVTIVSNSNTVVPTVAVKRFSQKEKKNIMVPQPQIIKKYNENMGGVDRADQNISLYRTSIRGKKWYFPLICHCLDMAVQNAWQLYRQCGGKYDHLSFRRSVALSLLETYKKMSKRGPSRHSANIHEHSKYDRLDHLVMYKDKQTRCGVCHKNCNFLCQKCNIALHPKECFVKFHTP